MPDVITVFTVQVEHGELVVLAGELARKYLHQNETERGSLNIVH